MPRKKKEDGDSSAADQSSSVGGGGGDSSSSGGAAATTKPKRIRKKAPSRQPPQVLPRWKVLLHNDDKNAIDYVIETVVMLTPLNKDQALQRTQEADKTGLSLLLITHKERAELYQEQFQSKGLTVTIEPEA